MNMCVGLSVPSPHNKHQQDCEFPEYDSLRVFTDVDQYPNIDFQVKIQCSLSYSCTSSTIPEKVFHVINYYVIKANIIY